MLAQVTLTPPLKWAGGKRWLVPTLREYWSEHAHRRLVEPFVGGMAVALGLNPSQALLNDANPHLMNFYSWIQQGLVIEEDMVNDSADFYSARERFNELIKTGHSDSKVSAELFYYLNRTGYNGLCRFNRQGLFNVPFGRYKTINYVDDFISLQEVMQRWQLVSGDFGELEIKHDDFLYADPPYDVEFTSYSQNGFDWSEQVRLAEWLTGHKGPVIASNQATPRILELYSSLDFEIQTLSAPRRISSDGNRTPVLEMLAFRNL